MFETEEFLEFVSLDCDREKILRSFFSARGIETSVITTGNHHHIHINFPQGAIDPTFKTKTIIAHYDRVSNTSGANDNSAAVWIIANWVLKLAKDKPHNLRVIFTDGEEDGQGGVSNQGAYALAELFLKMKILDTEIFVFDCCGRGEVAVLAQAGLSILKSLGPCSDLAKKIAALYERTQKLLIEKCNEKWISLPIPFSDNAGFLAWGIPSVLITFLPDDEASLYEAALLSDKNLSKMVMNSHDGEYGKAIPGDSSAKHDKIPFTWRLFHTKNDTSAKLTEESVSILEKILDGIADMRILC